MIIQIVRCNRDHGEIELAGERCQPLTTNTTKPRAEPKQHHSMTSRRPATDRTTSCQQLQHHSTTLCSYLATTDNNVHKVHPQETKFDLSFYTSSDTGHVTHFTAPDGAIDAECNYDRRTVWSSCFSHANMDYHQNQKHHSNFSNSIPDLLHRINSLEDVQIPQLHGESSQRRIDRKSLWLSPYESMSTAAKTPNPFQREATKTELRFDKTFKEVLDGVTSAADLLTRGNQNKTASLRPLKTMQTSNSSAFLHRDQTTNDVIGTRSLMFQPEASPGLEATSVAPPVQGYNNMLPSMRVVDKQTPMRQSANLSPSNIRKGFLPRFQYTQRR